ncbi:hypothetical protein PACTADRAFT_47669 [Pachysolen tannophilus NRRL Y-2460]|uniref:RRM domain-containing protein n=1 Tax=Pachysolen tannophilus NRRL Y-2460 TaxID=669874 RepID=A0A1E4U1P2_PACTA|nr:hypothetical protein PACTADRAFT_47669 [Pachysolen tannophilus NRRL Y-2460]
MSDTPTYPAKINKLFEPKQPVKYLEPTDYPLEKRRLPNISTISSFFDEVTKYNEEIRYNPTEGVQQKDQRLKKEKKAIQQQKVQNDLINWDPSKDPHIAGSDPYKTLFIGRLDYSITELELQKTFAKYGNISKIRVVKDKITSKSKGYAFIVYENERDARKCYKECNGLKLNDRSIVVDIERSRIMKNWKPRRLGGGLGGRHYTKKVSNLPTGPSSGYNSTHFSRNINNDRPRYNNDRFSHNSGRRGGGVGGAGGTSGGYNGYQKSSTRSYGSRHVPDSGRYRERRGDSDPRNGPERSYKAY